MLAQELKANVAALERELSEGRLRHDADAARLQGLQKEADGLRGALEQQRRHAEGMHDRLKVRRPCRSAARPCHTTRALLARGAPLLQWCGGCHLCPGGACAGG